MKSPLTDNHLQTPQSHNFHKNQNNKKKHEKSETNIFSLSVPFKVSSKKSRKFSDDFLKNSYLQSALEKI
jgi:hypothetical protein